MKILKHGKYAVKTAMKLLSKGATITVKTVGNKGLKIIRIIRINRIKR